MVSFDFAGTDPGTSTPWSTTSSIDPNVTLTQGVAIPASSWNSPGIHGKAGNDALYVETSSEGNADYDLSVAFANNLYATFTIAPKPGYALNLGGSTISAVLMRTGTDPAINDPWHAATGLSILSSVEGFSAAHVLASCSVAKWDSGNFSAQRNLAEFGGL